MDDIENTNELDLHTFDKKFYQAQPILASPTVTVSFPDCPL